MFRFVVLVDPSTKLYPTVMKKSSAKCNRGNRFQGHPESALPRLAGASRPAVSPHGTTLPHKISGIGCPRPRRTPWSGSPRPPDAPGCRVQAAMQHSATRGEWRVARETPIGHFYLAE